MGELHACHVGDSGGLLYHWRALRYRQRLWQPFIAQVARWLAAWHPPQRELVIVGPSAGYTLEAAFLARFERVVVLEPDPVARVLLRRRFATTRFEFGTLDCMADLAGPDALARCYPEAAILFSNVIGQRLAGLPPAWPVNLQRALAGHSWASYHDVIATETSPTRSDVRSVVMPMSLEGVLAEFWPQGGELAIYDHGSFGALPATEFVPWQLLPCRCHLVGWSSIIVVGSSKDMPGNSGIGGRS